MKENSDDGKEYSKQAPNSIVAKSKIQNIMNNTRDKLHRGNFKEDEYEIVPIILKTNMIGDSFDNYKIVQVSDIHLGQWINKNKLDGVVSLINNLNPDIIALTGDYVSYEAKKYLDELSECLGKLQSADGIFSVLGNHDHWTMPKEISKVMENVGIVNLNNDVYTIEKNEDKLQIAGVDSITVGQDDINKVLKKIDNDFPAIMLAHEPDFADTTSKYYPFILQLSGHSHGGQLTIPKLGSPIRGKNFLKYPSGAYKVNNMIQYTNRGIGTNAFWYRINCPPEITEIKLKKV
ncbi:MAG: metallophosphoesterase [Methanosphaera stadtmanae]|nr:metallophosphoesterase [Methanosphaera stadtmanae]